jgi:hypothetical protein
LKQRDDVFIFIYDTIFENDPMDLTLGEKYFQFLKSTQEFEYERKYYSYAKYLDNYTFRKKKVLVRKGERERNETSKTLSKIVSMYFLSIKFTHTYLWQSLPRLLEILFDKTNSNSLINQSIQKKLLELDTYKIAQVIPILLSRYSDKDFNGLICKLLAKITAEYPLQSLWWINHFKFFNYKDTVR